MILSAVLAVAWAIPFAPVAHAQNAGLPYWGPLLSCTGNYNDVVPTGGDGGPNNTCNDFCDLLDTGQNIINFVITIALFVGVPIMLVLGGIMIMLSGGAEERRSAGKSMMQSALIGAAIVIGAYVILNTFLWIAGNGASATKVSWPNIECDVEPYTPPAS